MAAQMLTPTALVQVAQFLDNNFSLSELHEVCFELGEDLADIAAASDTQKESARKVAIFFQQRGRALALVEMIKTKRPDLVKLTLTWEPILAQNEETKIEAGKPPEKHPTLPAKYLIAGVAAVVTLGLAWVAFRPQPNNGSNSSNSSNGSNSDTPAGRVAFARGKPGQATLVTRDLVSGKEQSLQKVGTDVAEPSWSPDGSRIVASAGQGTAHDLVIYTVADGSFNRISQNGNDIDPDWSRSDNRIYFVRGLTTQNGDLYAIKPDGSGLVSLGIKGRQPTVSPDGSYLAYMQKGDSDGFWRIHIAETRDMKDVCVLSANTTSPSPHLRMPSWMADSQGIVFNFADKNTEPQGMAYSDVKECRVKVSSIKGTGELKPLGRPSCSGDGRCVANQSASTGGNLRLLQFDVASNVYTDLGAVTANQPSGGGDFAPDIYP
jgi:Tol biopolymer transport system component